jgi:hypothetical protein
LNFWQVFSVFWTSFSCFLSWKMYWNLDWNRCEGLDVEPSKIGWEGRYCSSRWKKSAGFHGEKALIKTSRKFGIVPAKIFIADVDNLLNKQTIKKNFSYLNLCRKVKSLVGMTSIHFGAWSAIFPLFNVC